MMLSRLLLLTFSTFLQFCCAFTDLTDDTLRAIPEAGQDFDIKSGKLLSPLLIPRVSGTEGNVRARTFLIDFFKTELPKWQITTQNSSSTTPATGDKLIPFVNVIARRASSQLPEGDVNYLTLVAHYDSKLTPTDFIGATDSAAPCAMLLQIARNIDEALSKRWYELEMKGALPPSEGVQFLFLDGEEAFQNWSDSDSIYGARSLAAEWENEKHIAQSTFQDPLDAISIFVLLDLLGAKNPHIPSFQKTMHWAYKAMADLETRLRNLKLFRSDPAGNGNMWLTEHAKNDNSRWLGGNAIQDDHLPFMRRGVDILHLIPVPFPSVWHTMQDDGEHLDIATVEDWTKLVTAFTLQWMDLEGYMTVEKPRMTPRSEL